MNTKILLVSLAIIIPIYIIAGLVFTVMRSNAHYDYFVEGDYWQERCKEENNYYAMIYGTPGARWCIVDGEFTTEIPSRTQWYKSFYISNEAGYNGNFIGTMMLWWAHLLGNDMIHFRSVGGWFS